MLTTVARSPRYRGSALSTSSMYWERDFFARKFVRRKLSIVMFLPMKPIVLIPPAGESERRP